MFDFWLGVMFITAAQLMAAGFFTRLLFTRVNDLYLGLLSVNQLIFGVVILLYLLLFAQFTSRFYFVCVFQSSYHVDSV